MLELNAGPSPSDLIKDTSEPEFVADVIEASQEVPVIVDFWAPWCGPCKTLGPALESAVLAVKGAVKMVKVNADDNQQIAAQMRIQSLPTVYAFYKGRPVDAFQGALPASEIKAFIDKLIKLAGGDASGGLDEAVEAAESMLEEGAAVDAAQTFAAILGEDPAHAGAYGGLVRSHLAMGELDQAEALLNNVTGEMEQASEIEAARAQLELARQAEGAGPVQELITKLEGNPDDHQLRFDLSTALHASGNTADAIDQLLELFRRDRDWNDGAAKAQLFTIFDALKPEDPLVLNGRRKLSSMIFV